MNDEKRSANRGGGAAFAVALAGAAAAVALALFYGRRGGRAVAEESREEEVEAHPS